jgi:hypothetical protein
MPTSSLAQSHLSSQDADKYCKYLAFWEYGIMKTTLEIPDEIYLEAKSIAGLKRKKMKDLVTRGLQLVLEEEKKAASPSPLEVMKHIKSHPPYTPQIVKEWQEEAYQARKKGWDGDG